MLEDIIQDYRFFMGKQKSLSDKDYRLLLVILDLLQAHQLILEKRKAKTLENRVVIKMNADHVECFSDKLCSPYLIMRGTSDNMIQRISPQDVFIGSSLVDETLRL